MTTSLPEFNSVGYLFPNFKEILETDQRPIDKLIKIDQSGKLLVDLYEQTLEILHVSQASPDIKKLSEKIANAFIGNQNLRNSGIVRTFKPTSEQNNRFKKIYVSFYKEEIKAQQEEDSVQVAASSPTLKENLDKARFKNLNIAHLVQRRRLQQEQTSLQPGELIIANCTFFFQTFVRDSANAEDDLYAFIQAQNSLQDLRVTKKYLTSLNLTPYIQNIQMEFGNPSHENISKYKYNSWELILMHYMFWMLLIIDNRITQINASKMRNREQKGSSSKV